MTVPNRFPQPSPDSSLSSPTSSPALDLQRLAPEQVEDLGERIRRLSRGAHSRQVAAERVVELLSASFRRDDGEPAFVLARCFETFAYARLPLEYRDAADRLLEDTKSQPEMRCLALLATRGVRPLWNNPSTSAQHQAIPLPSAEFVRRAPMISRLVEQMGVPIEAFVAKETESEFTPSSTLFNVFFVDEAEGSPFLPAQTTFVQPFGVRSVVGFGGILGPGDFFAVILFSRVPISREVAALFRPLAQSVEQALRPFPADRLFGDAL